MRISASFANAYPLTGQVPLTSRPSLPPALVSAKPMAVAAPLPIANPPITNAPPVAKPVTATPPIAHPRRTGFWAIVFDIFTVIGDGLLLLIGLIAKPGLGKRGVGGSLTTTGNELELLVDGDQMQPALLTAINGAQHSLWLNVYEFQSEATSLAVTEAILAARARGVDVKIVVDNRFTLDQFANGAAQNPLLDRLVAAGCAVRWVEYSGFRVNHRKVMVVDGETAIVMGMNIGGNYLGPLKAGWTYHDAGVRLRGPGVQDVAATFADSWHRAGGGKLTLPARSAPIANAHFARAHVELISHRGGSDRNIERELIDRINGEKKRIVLINGFGMVQDIRDALLAARARGVKVLWLWGEASHSSTLMAEDSFSKLAKAGVVIRQYPNPLHMKAYVFGGNQLLIGSSNLDGFSNWENDEDLMKIRSQSFVREFFKRVVRPDVAKSAAVVGTPVPTDGVVDDILSDIVEPIID